MIIEGNKDNFNDFLKEDLILVDFFANWCGPCKMLAKVLESVSKKVDIKIVKINVDDNESLAKQYGIMSIPTLIIFKNGDILSTHTGYMDEDSLQEWIEKSINI